MTTKDNVPDDSEFRITRLRAKNYRSIRNLDMGGIQSGKSSSYASAAGGEYDWRDES